MLTFERNFAPAVEGDYFPEGFVPGRRGGFILEFCKGLLFYL